MSFDPNKEGKESRVWATYIPERRPKFKTYSNRSHAVNSMYCKAEYVEGSNYKQKFIPDEIKFYKLVDGLWVEVRFNRTYDKIKRLNLDEIEND